MKKYILSLSVAVVALGAMAFTQSERANTRTFTYQFMGTQLSQANDPSAWQEATSSPSCPSGSFLPCTVVTNLDIEEWIGEKSDDDVLNTATSKRN